MPLRKPAVVAVCGSKNSGKTDLIVNLIPLLSAAGLKVAVVKHHGHAMDLDVPGTDTYRFFLSGAVGTVLSDDAHFSLTKRSDANRRDFAEFFPEADLILLEGFKDSSLPKIEMRRGANDAACALETLIAVVCDETEEMSEARTFRYGDYEGVAALILGFVDRGAAYPPK
jgi:molybdopterin-guanine dinucleotide biosynthesis protein B